MATKARKRTSLEIEQTLYEEFQIACIRRKISNTDAVEEALREWVFGFAPAEGAADKDAAMVKVPGYLLPVVKDLVHRLRTPELVEDYVSGMAKLRALFADQYQERKAQLKKA